MELGVQSSSLGEILHLLDSIIPEIRSLLDKREGETWG